MSYPEPPEPDEEEIEKHMAEQDKESLKVQMTVDVPVIHPDRVLSMIAQQYIDKYLQKPSDAEAWDLAPRTVQQYVKKQIDEAIGKHLQAAIKQDLDAEIRARVTQLLDGGWTATDQYGGNSRQVTLKTIIVEWMNGKSGDYSSPTKLVKLIDEKLREAVTHLFSEKGIFYGVLADAKKKLADEVDAGLREKLRRILQETLGRFS